MATVAIHEEGVGGLVSRILDSAWLDWYKAKHRERFTTSSGESFETYVTTVLRFAYPDFIDPSPMGQGGDGGCDGLSSDAGIFFACYGQRAQSNQDAKTNEKLKHDFMRALAAWPPDYFKEWQFVTNASFGTGPAKTVLDFMRAHEKGTERPLSIRVVDSPELFWSEHMSNLNQRDLDTLFPGAPHVQSVELSDLVDLLNALGNMPCNDVEISDLRPVSDKKMDYNCLPIYSRYELNTGRLMSQRINQWFSEQPNPELRDEKAAKFTEIYLNAKNVTAEPSEILYRIYVAVAGPDFAMNRKLANAAYALVAYFFDTCDIFERVPEGNHDSSD